MKRRVTLFLTVFGVVSLVVVITALAAGLKVAWPNGGETLYADSTYQLRWTDSSPVQYVTIAVTTNDPNEFLLGPIEVPNYGTYNWTVPEGTDEDACLFAVWRDTTRDVSDGPFKILPE